MVVSTAECIIGNDVFYACTVNGHMCQRVFSCSGTTTCTALSWLVQQKQYINSGGKREISASIQGIMTAGVLGEAISLYSSTAFLTQLPNTADTEPPSPPAKFLFKLKVLPMEIL